MASAATHTGISLDPSIAFSKVIQLSVNSSNKAFKAHAVHASVLITFKASAHYTLNTLLLAKKVERKALYGYDVL